MQDLDTGRFTVGVFQDFQWAEKGISALSRHGFPAEALSIVAKESPEAAELIQRTLGGAPERFNARGIGPILARGPLVTALQGPERDFSKHGIAATMRRVGFQGHDGFIFEALMGRGGVLVAIRSEPLAAEALALLLSYGGGNAAIGAWTGRV